MIAKNQYVYVLYFCKDNSIFPPVQCSSVLDRQVIMWSVLSGLFLTEDV